MQEGGTRHRGGDKPWTRSSFTLNVTQLEQKRIRRAGDGLQHFLHTDPTKLRNSGTHQTQKTKEPLACEHTTFLFCPLEPCISARSYLSAASSEKVHFLKRFRHHCAADSLSTAKNIRRAAYGKFLGICDLPRGRCSCLKRSRDKATVMA